MDGGRADTEVPLQISFGGRPAEHARIDIDEGQILTLLECESVPLVNQRYDAQIDPYMVASGLGFSVGAGAL